MTVGTDGVGTGVGTGKEITVGTDTVGVGCGAGKEITVGIGSGIDVPVNTRVDMGTG